MTAKPAAPLAQSSYLTVQESHWWVASPGRGMALFGMQAGYNVLALGIACLALWRAVRRLDRLD